MSKYIITVTSECISAASGRPYNSGKFEGSNEVKAESKRAALEQEIANYRLENVIETTFDDEYGAVVSVALSDGGRKDYFFDI